MSKVIIHVFSRILDYGVTDRILVAARMAITERRSAIRQEVAVLEQRQARLRSLEGSIGTDAGVNLFAVALKQQIQQVEFALEVMRGSCQQLTDAAVLLNSYKEGGARSPFTSIGADGWKDD